MCLWARDYIRLQQLPGQYPCFKQQGPKYFREKQSEVRNEQNGINFSIYVCLKISVISEKEETLEIFNEKI